MRKYRNSRFTNEFGTFDSSLEYYRYLYLLQAEKEGLISNLERQKKFVLIPAQYAQCTFAKSNKNGIIKKQTKKILLEKECAYLADFVYKIRVPETGIEREVIEDTKGYRTKDYIIKRKLMRYLGNPITEINNAGEKII